MPKTIEQEITFSAPPEELFNIYMDSTKHSKAIGAKAVISKIVRGKISSHDGLHQGKKLPNYPGSNDSSILAWFRLEEMRFRFDFDFNFYKTKKGGRGNGQLNMVHANVPDDQYSGLKQGWNDFYWKPWEQYLNTVK